MRLEAPAIVDLVLTDPTNPHAVAFQLAEIDRHLAELPRDLAHSSQDRELLATLRKSFQAANVVALCEPSADGGRSGLETFLADVGGRMGKIAEAIALVYFTHTAMPRELGGLAREQDI